MGTVLKKKTPKAAPEPAAPRGSQSL